MLVKKILVTGSSGTIGTRLCEKLLEKGYDVVGVDKVPNAWNSRISDVTVIGDLLDSQTLKRLPANVDVVVHFAANARVYNLVETPSLARENFETVFNALEFCRLNNIPRFLFASSREVYGNSLKVTHSEDEVDVMLCESPYTASKLAGEALVQAYRRCYGVNFIITRFSNVYGMYDDSDRVIPLFIRQTLKNDDLVVYGGEKVLDFTYIDDAVSGVLSCIERFDSVGNNVFNLASGAGASIVEVADKIRQELGGKNKIVVKENRTGEVVKFVADISKARQSLEYSPQTSIAEGIRKTVEWYKTHG